MANDRVFAMSFAAPPPLPTVREIIAAKRRLRTFGRFACNFGELEK